MEKEYSTRSILFSLIQSELSNKKFDNERLKNLSSEKLEKLYELAKAHDVVHLIAFALDKQKMLTQDEISQKYQKQIMLAIFRYEKIDYEQKRISEILENNEIKFILLKGAVIRKFYPEPWMRTSCDIDVLVHQEDIDKAISVLKDAGFTQEISNTKYDYTLNSPSGIHLELHYSLDRHDSILMAEPVLDKVWDECRLQEGKKNEHYMSNEMFLFYHIVHLAKHFSIGGCGIRPLIDLWLLTKNLEFNNEKLYSFFLQTKLLVFYEACVQLSKVWMEDAPHTDITYRMEQFILTGGVYGNVSNAVLVQAAKGESKIGSFFKLVFLPKEKLEKVYPNLKKHPILLPFYQVKRWFKLFNKKKRNNAKSIIKERNNVSVEQKKETEDLLNQLGLL